MAITDAKKLDYLWKKIGYGATKTDTNANKAAPNEAIASPLLLRGDKVWNQASSIPGTQPGSTSGVVTVYPTSAPDETTADNTATANRTYGLQVNSDGQGVVNVPWTDTVFSLPLAADGTRGGVQIGYAENGKNYPVELSSEKMYVNVPWVNTEYSNSTTSAARTYVQPTE